MSLSHNQSFISQSNKSLLVLQLPQDQRNENSMKSSTKESTLNKSLSRDTEHSKQNEESEAPQIGQEGAGKDSTITSSKNKTLKFFIKFKMGKKQYEIDFKYDLDRDNPTQIAKEMKENLKLP